MTSSPPPATPGPSSATSRIWTVTVTALVVLVAGALVPLALVHIAAAAAFGVVGALVVLGVLRLRREQVRAVSEARRLNASLRHTEQESARRENEWRAFIDNGSERVRLEAEHVLEHGLPAALDGGPAVALPYGDTPVSRPLTQLLDRLVEGVEHREESQRLAVVELASRVQTSAHRIQARVAGLTHRHPGDADLLEAAMEVDHAATQQARHAQSLKVLCGEWPGQQWQKPLALVDVVRAASGRIVAFKRVQVTGDPDIGAASAVVEPLIHLTAELLANATEYSPPKTAVSVSVRTVQRGAVIEIDDGGLGLDEYRLAEAREIVSGRRVLELGEVGEIPRTGFAVVGRFARRHDFHVDLGPSPYGGVRCVVLIPSASLEALDPVGTRLPHETPPPADAAPADPAVIPAPQQEPQPGPRRTPQPEPHHAPAAVPGRGTETATAGRLPKRRSRRDAYRPDTADATPAPSAPPGTPEAAGDWMEQFFEGGRSLTDPETYGTPPSPGVPPHPGSPGSPGSPDPTESTDSPEGRI